MVDWPTPPSSQPTTTVPQFGGFRPTAPLRPGSAATTAIAQVFTSSQVRCTASLASTSAPPCVPHLNLNRLLASADTPCCRGAPPRHPGARGQRHSGSLRPSRHPSQVRGESLELTCHPYHSFDASAHRNTAATVADCRHRGGAVPVHLRLPNRHPSVREDPQVRVDSLDKQ